MRKFSLITKASSRRSSRNKKLLLIGVVFIVVLGLLFLLPRAASFVASLVFSPVVAVEEWLRESDDTIPAYIRSRNDLLAIIEEQGQELSQQSGADLTIRRLQLENIELRNLLGASSSPRIIAGVIGRPTVVPYDVLVLDQGSVDGVIEGAAVFTGRDQVIGYVHRVFAETSLATLVTTPGAESTVYIIGPNIYTTAVGQGGGVLEVGVPQGVPLSLGDLVVVPSFEAGVYGEIVHIESLKTGAEQYAYVITDTPLQSLRWVSIGLESITPMSFDEARAVVDRVRNELTTVPVPEGVLVELPDPVATTSTSGIGTTSPTTTTPAP